MADEARITYAPPTVPAQRVLELKVNGSLTGQGFELTFNDGFNALIGGRGSGKSAVLEYLRFGLGRSTIDMAEDASRDRERDLITSTLVGGHVEVLLERDGVQEVWRRTLDKQACITVTAQGTEAVELPVSTAQERFRARAFSQKQLSTLVRRPETADEQITGIAAAEWVDLRHQMEKEIESAEREVHLAFQRVVQGWAAEASSDRAATATIDLKRRVNATRERLEQAGLTETQQIILDRAPKYARAEAQFESTLRDIDRRLSAVAEIGEIELSGWDQAAEIPDALQAQQILTQANQRIAEIKDELGAVLLLARNGIDEARGSFESRYSEFKVKSE